MSNESWGLPVPNHHGGERSPQMSRDSARRYIVVINSDDRNSLPFFVPRWRAGAVRQTSPTRRG